MTDKEYLEQRRQVLLQVQDMIRMRDNEPPASEVDAWIRAVLQDAPLGHSGFRWVHKREQNALRALEWPRVERVRAHAEALFTGKVELTDDLIDALYASYGSQSEAPPPIKAIAFDAFGTLVTIGDKRAPYARLLGMGGTVPARSPMTAPMDLATTAALANIVLAPDVLTGLESDLAAELASVALFPEALRVLDAVRGAGLRVAVASNLASPYADPLKALLGPHVDEWCLSYDVGAVKPDPAFYAGLCDRLGCAPGEVLMVGDTWRCDYAGAALAGLQALHLDRRGNATRNQAPVSIPNLTGVFDHLHGPRPLPSPLEPSWYFQ